MTAPAKKPDFLGGSAWMLGMRWAMRLIGLATTVILARLLDPFDFGIIAMAMIVIGLLQIITWTGVDLALIKEPNCTPDHYNSAWTIQIIQGTALALILLAVAPFSEGFFKEPGLVAVIQALAANAFIQGFTNTGVVDFRKNIDFATEFRYGVYKKLSAFFITVPAAFILGNYWAIVVAMIATHVIEVALSYIMHPFRPRISFKKMKEIWSFSQWLLVSRIGFYLNRKADALIVGNVMGTNSIGFYHVAFEIGTLFSNEFVMPIRRALLPNIALLGEDREAFLNAVYTMIGAISFLGFAAGFGVSAIAPEFTHFVLGDKWTTAVPLIHWFAIFGAFAGVSLGLEAVLLATGKSKISAIEAWAQLAVVVPVIYAVATHYDLATISIARTLIAVVFLCVMILLVSRTCSLSAGKIVFSVIRPFTAATIMLLSIEALKPAGEPSVMVMIGSVVGGATVFLLSSALIWLVTGKPKGIEAQVLERITKRFAPQT